MSPRPPLVVESNPFSTRFVRPGAIPYLFPEFEDAGLLVDRLRQRGWLGQIVGPRGTGKSTLVAALLPVLRDAGREPILIALRDRMRRLPPEARARLAGLPRRGSVVVVVDGYEQLGRWSRFLLRRWCRGRGFGLLATTHRSVGLPQIHRTNVTPAIAHRVVDRLLSGTAPTVAPFEVAERLEARQGNLREALFDLYDLHEQRRNRGRNRQRASRGNLKK